MMKFFIIIILSVILSLGVFLNLGLNTQTIKKENKIYTMEELILIEFAVKLEDLEFKFKDFHRTKK